VAGPPLLAAGPHEGDDSVEPFAKVYATSATAGLGWRDQRSGASSLVIGENTLLYPNRVPTT
jgi:hypothetical protein